MKITKHAFNEIITALQDQMKHDEECGKIINTIYPNAWSANLLYDNSKLIDGIIALLNEYFGDMDAWICYYVYDLDFGKKYIEGMVKDADGANIPLAHSGDLYNLLTRDKQ